MNFRKMRNSFRRDLRAISPIIATLLLIAIAVVAALVTYAWVMGYMSFTTTNTSKTIMIQSVATTSTTALNVYVQNTGSATVTLINNACLYLNGTLDTGASFASGTGLLTTGQTITIQSGPLNIASLFGTSYAISSGDTFNVKVTTSSGQMMTLTWTAP